jgi:hypothetical protein
MENTIVSVEEKAVKLASDPKTLRERFSEYLHTFGEKSSGYKLNFKEKTYIKTYPLGKVVLTWKLRESPDKPISYLNQQTSIGFVERKMKLEISKKENSKTKI